MSADDEQLAPLGDYTYRELQKLCKDFNVSPSGKRHELEARLAEVIDAAEDDEDEEVDESGAEEEDEEEMDAAVTAEENEEEDDDEDDEDDEDEDDDEDDEDDDEGVEPEVLGLLVRAPDGGEDGEDVYFISAEDFEKEWKTADSEVNGEAVEYGDDADADDEDDDVLFGVQTTRWQHVSRNVANAAAAFEFFTFVVLLCGVLTEAQKVGDSATDSSSTVSSDAVYGEPRTLAEAFYLAFITHAFTLTFWSTVLYYTAVFYALPTVVGLIFGNYWTSESVFVFALSRYSLYYLLYGSSIVFAWSAFPFQERVFTVTCAVSFLMAFWEKQSTIFV